MTRRGAIAQIAMMVAQDIARGAPSQGALAAGPMLAQAGATPDLVACLVAEAGRKRPGENMVEAYAYLLESALNDLRIAGNGGDATARAALDEAHAAVGRAVAGKGLAPAALMMIARAFAQAELAPCQALKDATLAAMDAGFAVPERTMGQSGLGDHLAQIARALDHDPFAIHAQITATGAAFPPEHRAGMAAELATSAVEAVRDAAIGFLFDPDPAPGAAVLATLVSRAGQQKVPSRLIERLVAIRPWLSTARRPDIDAAVRRLRGNAEAPVPAAAGEVQARLASLCDGAGAQSLFALLKRGRRFALASVLVKVEAGVADAWVREDMTKREADQMAAEIRAAAEAVDVPAGLFERRLADALAMNVARDVPPPFGLLQVTEALGIGGLHPAAFAPAALADALLEDLATELTGPAATRAAHQAAADWPDMFDTLASWFEAGEEVDALLRPLTSRRKRIEAMLTHYLPGRRGFWAERCAWMAAILQDSRSEHKASWVDFALVARDLAGAERITGLPLMDAIAEASVDAFAARPVPRRPLKRRGG